MKYKEDRITLLLCKKSLEESLSEDEQAELTQWVKLNEKELFNFEITQESFQMLKAYEEKTEEALKQFKMKYLSQCRNRPALKSRKRQKKGRVIKRKKLRFWASLIRFPYKR